MEGGPCLRKLMILGYYKRNLIILLGALVSLVGSFNP